MTLYLHTRGENEVPTNWHRWACLSLLAACAEDRVWYEKHPGRKLTPHLYVFLVGPGSLGKGHAISEVVSLMKAAGLKWPQGLVRIHRGPITFKGVIDKLSQPVVDEVSGSKLPPSAKLWVLMDELGNDVGTGPLAKNFIKMMTELYTGDYDFEDTTRTHGSRVIRDASCVNWTAGSQESWMMETITPDDVRSGAAARIVFVFEDDKEDVRYVRPVLPFDWTEVTEYLIARLKMMPYIEGQFHMTENAEKLEKKWYLDRRRPDDRDLRSSWKRGQDLAIKLAMLHAIADGEFRKGLVIEYKHMHRAIGMSEFALGNMVKLLEASSQTPETKSANFLQNILVKLGEVGHTPLSRMVCKRGMNAKMLREAMWELKGRGLVGYGRSNTGGIVYTWKGK